MVANTFETLPSYHLSNGIGKDTCQWLAHVKLSRIIILTSTVLFIVPLFTHYYLSKVYYSIMIYM